MLITDKPEALLPYFNNSGVWAYPTEAVYGLGCNPDDETAVQRLLAIKQRSVKKGLILIAADFSQVTKYLKPLTKAQQVFTQPSATSYLFPVQSSIPHWLTGEFDTLAVRITMHPAAKAMCEALDSAIVSTSANLSGQPPAKSSDEVIQQFSESQNTSIDALLSGKTGDSAKPSVIRDSISGKIIRS